MQNQSNCEITFDTQLKNRSNITLKMTSTQVDETSVIVNNISFPNYTNPHDHTQQTIATIGFKPFVRSISIIQKYRLSSKPDIRAL